MAGEPATSASTVDGKGVPAESVTAIEQREDDAQDLDEDETGSEDAEGEGQAPGGPRPLIFISYRHGSDQPIASALKVLIGGAITPSPEVFVASEGGIRPSQLGYKSQLQAAVQRAAAFIGVITQTSKDREWLYFEAGAAWGQGKLYAPLLVEMTANELTTTLSDLQTTNARSVDEVRRLLDEIALQIQARLKDRFGTRYARFARSFQPTPPVANLKPENSGNDPQIAEVIALLSAGKTDEANAIIAGLEAEAPNMEAKAKLRVSIILNTKGSHYEKLKELEQLPVQYAHSSSYLMWKALWGNNNETSRTCLRELLTHGDASPYMRRFATAELARYLYEVKQEDKATELLLTGLSSGDRELQHDAAMLWCENREADPPLLRLALAAFGDRAQPSAELLTQQVKISIQQGWRTLAIFCAESAHNAAATGTTANNRGRAYSTALLQSLAYSAFQGAVALGVSVARVNMAAIVGRSAAPIAGIQLLDQHQGPFDAASPSYPYDTRAALEKAVHEEKERGDRLHKNGEILNRLLTDIMELALRFRPVRPHLEYTIDGHQFTCSHTANVVELTPVRQSEPTARGVVNGALAEALNSVAPLWQTTNTPTQAITIQAATVTTSPVQIPKLVLRPLCIDIPLWEVTIKERNHILTLDDEGALSGISVIGLTVDEPDPKPVRFESTTPNHVNNGASSATSTQNLTPS